MVSFHLFGLKWLSVTFTQCKKTRRSSYEFQPHHVGVHGLKPLNASYPEVSEMYKTILVPLDGSKRAEAIFPHVEDLARRYDATVFFLQVVEPSHYVLAPESAYLDLYEENLEQQTTEARSYLEGVEGMFREKGVRTGSSVVHGPVVEGIINTAEREGADLIALASHGRTGLSRVFYGSVAAGVLNRIDRPLLLIRSQHQD